MDKSVVNRIRNIIVNHEAFNKGITTLHNCYKLKTGGYSGHLGVSIFGESGVGKSTLIRKFVAAHQGTRTSTQTYSPIIVVTVPPKPSGTSLCSAILNGLNDPFASNRDTEDKKRGRAIHLIKKCETSVIILDEMQHFTNRWNNKVAHDAADSLKSIVDETNVMMVIAGLEYGKSLFVQNEQLRRRFTYNITLPRFDWNNVASRKQFRGILKFLRNEIAPFQVIDLSAPEISYRMYLASGGITSYLMTLLEHAALMAYTAGNHEIGLEQLEKAYDSIQGLTSNMSNPFSQKLPSSQFELLNRQVESIGIADIDKTTAKKRGSQDSAKLKAS